MTRPTPDQYFLDMATLAATRGTCCRRQVGCVLVNKMNRVLSTGYNGRYAGAPHCNEGFPCEGADLPSGTGLDKCEALHAESSALLFCSNVYDINTCYVTVTPCIECTKMLLNTSCQRIVALTEYPHPAARRLWEQAGRDWEVRLDLSGL
jgi:dCMP deaminase